MSSLVETTHAERDAWSTLRATPDEDDIQRLISDAARAAEFESVMDHVLVKLSPLVNTNAEKDR